MSARPFPPLVSVARRKMRSATYRLKWTLLSEWLRLPAVKIDAVTSVPRSEICEPVMDDVCMPPFSGMPHDDLGTVLRIAKSLRPKVICEIGTAHGNLTANLLRNCPDATMVTVNAPTHLQSGNLVTYKLTEHEIGRVYRKYGYEDRVIQLLVNSLELDLKKSLKSDLIDLAIIDGCHDTDFVLNDFQKMREFVRPGGVVLLHDTHPSQEGHLAGSYRACLLLRREGFDMRWIQDTWWGYWRQDANRMTSPTGTFRSDSPREGKNT